MSERQTTGEFKNYIIGQKSGKTYNKIQEMAEEIVRLQKENEELKEKLDFEERSEVFYQEQYFKIKDKIKDKIKQIDKDIKQVKKQNTFVHYDILDQATIRKLEYAKAFLEDLLKEN